MGAARIGALRVDLGLNSAAFENGLSLMQRKLAGVTKSLEKVGDKFTSVGKSMLVGISAPLAVAGGAILASAKQIAESVPELEKFAAMANISTQEFQRLAFAAKSVGFESDKLGDIYKDVNDKVGDFMSTGGGEMADFFTNIAPKVGITAEAFRNLSGPQALQLYYDSLERAGVSQAEMTFYLEAIANDATALIPLLKQNGAAFDQLGAKANVLSEADKRGFQDYINASGEMEQAFQKLTVALVNSGLLDAIVAVLIKITDLATSLSQTSPELLNIGVIAGGVAFAFGPLLIGIGSIISAFAKMLPVLSKLGPLLKIMPGLLTAVGVAFRFMLGPVGLAITAIGLVYMAWKNWDKIEPIIKRLYTAVKTWIVDKLNAIWDGVRKRIEAVKGYFYDLYDAVVGNSYVPDMVDGIADQMARLEAVMVKPAATATERASQAFEAMATRVGSILDRLFPESRTQLEFNADVSALEDALKRGKISADQFAEAMRRLKREHADAMLQLERNSPDTIQVQALSAEDIPQMFEEGYRDLSSAMDGVAQKADVTAVRVVDSFKDMAEKTIASFGQLANSIKSGGFLGILESVIGFGLQLGSIGAFGKTIQTNLNTPLAGARALGGPVRAASSYLVGERGPEIFTPDRAGKIIPNNKIGGGNGFGVTVTMDPSTGALGAFVRNEAGQVVASAAPGLIGGASSGTQAAMGRKRMRQLPA